MLENLLLITCLLGVTPLATATPPKPLDPAILKSMAKSALSSVENLRGQKLSKPLKSGVKKKPEVTRFITERLADEYGPAKVRAEGDLLKLLGLIPTGLDYGDFMTRLLTEQVAGFYDHTRQELYLADWIPLFLQEPVMAHEIFHAIQDQEWGGGKLIDSKLYSHDEVLAHAALMEGDATVVMLMHTAVKAGGSGDDVSPFMLNMMAATIPLQMSSAEYPVMTGAPDYIKQSLVFPYQHGISFLAALRTAGWTWADFRKLYADPPASTEQILHPERYAPTRDEPSRVTVALPNGFTRTWDGVAGELHFRQVLLTNRPTGDAIEAAAGWDGDFTALLTDGRRQVIECVSTWDSEADAIAYATALQAWDTARAPAGKPKLVLERKGSALYYTLSTDALLANETLSSLPLRTKIVVR